MWLISLTVRMESGFTEIWWTTVDVPDKAAAEAAAELAVGGAILAATVHGRLRGELAEVLHAEQVDA